MSFPTLAAPWMIPRSNLPIFRDTGRIERRNPLPKGTYWIDQVGNENIAAFEDWISRNQPVVGLISSEQTDDNPRAFWYLFKVTGGSTGEFLPQWDGPGLPNIAEPGVTKSSDTVSSPHDMGVVEFFFGSDVASRFDTVIRGADGAISTVKVGVVLAGVSAVGYVGYRVAVKQGWI